MRSSQSAHAVDVFTVWHNRSRYVNESLMSIIRQTFDDYRIIAVDDGSSDGTYDALCELIPVAARHDVELVVIRQNNQGFTKSLVGAISQYTDSNYIALHGAGDISLPERLEKQFHLHQLYDSSVVGAWVDVISVNGSVLTSRRNRFIQNRNINRFVIPRPGTHGAAMIDRNIYDRVGGYRAFFEYAQDSDLWIRASRESPFRNVQEVLYLKKRFEGCVGEDRDKSKLQRTYATFAIQCEIERERNCRWTPDLEEVGDVRNAVSQWLVFKRYLIRRYLRKR